MKVLYINSCVREESRTDRLARRLLQKYGTYQEINLNNEKPEPLQRESLERRTRLINEEEYSSEIFRYARQFAEADVIVISAPYWDLAFPALLKIYLENIYVTGLVSRYDENGTPEGLCRAGILYYVATAGGPFDTKYSYDYIHDLAVRCFGIRETKLITAEMLDVQGVDPEAIMEDTLRKIDAGVYE